MKKIILKYITILCGIIGISACTESYDGLEIIRVDSQAPGKVTVNKVIPQSGALEIHFSLTKGDTDIAQVVASYVQNGVKRDFKVSRFVSSILVEGFTGVAEQTVEIKCVDNSGNVSEPTFVKGTALLSPIEVAYQSLTAEAAFGGVKVAWKNTTGDFLAIHVLTDDSLQIKGQKVFMEDPSKMIYTRETDKKKTYAYVRNYPDKEQRFGFSITDKWGNVSDTLITTLTPFREDVIAYQQIKALKEFNPRYTNGKSMDYETEGIDPVTGIQYDALYYGEASYGPQTLFDGKKDAAFYITRYTKNFNDLDDSNDELVPNSYSTYNLNVEAILGRMHIYHRPVYYGIHAAKRFRIWGTTDENLDRFVKFPEGWTLVGEYVLPDAVNNKVPTPDEKSAWDSGFELNVTDDNVNPEANPKAKIRYLRIEMMETYDPSHKVITMNEIFLWGQIEKKYY